MPVYTVHAPPAKRGGDSKPEDYVFLRDGFHVWAMIFGPFWMLFRRLWLVFFLYLVLVAALAATLWALGAGEAAGGLPMALLSVLIGLEAGSLWRWTLSRRGWRNVGLVVADNVEAAERRFFDRLASVDAPARPDPSPPPVVPARSAAPPTVIGLFPEPGAPR